MDALSVTVYVDLDIRKHLGMKNNSRKTKLNFPKMLSDNTTEPTIQFVRNMIETKYPLLLYEKYLLRYQLTNGQTSDLRQFQSDEDVANVIDIARRFRAGEYKRLLQLYVDIAPGVFPPPLNSESYLLGMPNPMDSPSYSLISFYKFPEAYIAYPQEVADQLRTLWKPFQALGRVYVAREGVNAQMAIPTNVLRSFETATCDHFPVFASSQASAPGDKGRMRINVDHVVSRQNIGSFNGNFAIDLESSGAEESDSMPFRNLHIRVRKQILTDGLDHELDWQHDGGEEVSPLDWHRRLDDPNAVILDCRNSYESDVGKFNNAVPLNTSFFWESWDAMNNLKELQGKPKDTPILTYCTGGIRCVKINAYMQQVMGFTNVGRLEGGIINYTRALASMGNTLPQGDVGGFTSEVPASTAGAQDKVLPEHLRRHVENSKFKGVNYVFDERMVARVTEDVLAVCETCGQSCDVFINCSNCNCHVRFIQCSNCRHSYSSCCSMHCQMEMKNRNNAIEKQSVESFTSMSVSSSALPVKSSLKPVNLTSEDITDLHTFPVLKQSKKKSRQSHPEIDHAVKNWPAAIDYCDQYSQRESVVLSNIRAVTQQVYGHNNAMMRMISSPVQGQLLSMLVCTARPKLVLELGCFTGYSAAAMAQGLLQANSSDDYDCTSKVISCDVDDVAISIAQKLFAAAPVINAKIELYRATAEEMIFHCRENGCRFDVVFIDANKKMYKNYLLNLMGEGSSGQECLLRNNALIIVDNTLWKGLVVDLNCQVEANDNSPENVVASSVHDFNKFAANHPLLTPVMLSMRDGLTLLRYGAIKDI